MVQPTPQLPSVPANSFAFSNPGASWTVPSFQTSNNNSPTQRAKGEPALFSALLKSVRVPPKSTNGIGSPRTFCLLDPLTELGAIVEGFDAEPRGTVRFKRPYHLDIAETILYVSTADELRHPLSNGHRTPPLLLALTSNYETGKYNLWTVAYNTTEALSSPKGENTFHARRDPSRRRSSYKPGAVVGAKPSATRASLGPRESFGGTKEAVPEQTIVRNDVDLAAQLDPASEPPVAPANSSRRVSSLLARSGLASSRDRNAFNDFTSAQPAAVRARRGPSLPNYGSRSSIGNSPGVKLAPRRSVGMAHSVGGSGFSDDLPDRNLLENEDSDEDSTAFDNSGSDELVPGLRKAMCLKKIEGISIDRGYASFTRVLEQLKYPPKVFTLQPPVLEHDGAPAEVIMCLVDHELGRLTVLQIHVLSPAIHGRDDNRGNAWKETSQQHIAGVTNIRLGDKIIDACKVSNGLHTRILVLGQSSDGFGELTLQAPWSNYSTKVRLPNTFSIYNPYQINHGMSPGRRHEGGFKRVLSQGPQALTALKPCTGGDQFDIVDQQGTRHRLELQVSPHDSLVTKLIDVCQLVLPQENPERESILRVWWEIVSWLSDRPEPVANVEWTAFVVVIFSLVVGFIDDRQTQHILRQKKRKAGFERSSTGSNIDETSWDSMLQREGNACGSSPVWLQSTSWRWALEEEAVSPSALAFQAGSSRQSRSPLSATQGLNAMYRKSPFLLECMSLAREFIKSPAGQTALGPMGYLPTALSKDSDTRRTALPTILVALHLFREELKLDVLASKALHMLTPILAQLGGWLNWETWSWRETSYYILDGSDMEHWIFDDSLISHHWTTRQLIDPPSIFNYLENVSLGSRPEKFINLLDITTESALLQTQATLWASRSLKNLTPRTVTVMELLKAQSENSTIGMNDMVSCGMNITMLESLPEGIAAVFQGAILACQANPVSTWTVPVLAMIGRDDISMLERPDRIRPSIKSSGLSSHEAHRDMHVICNSTLEPETVGAYDGSAELDRQSITRLIFKEDQRFTEAAQLVHPLKPSVARCVPEPDWTDTDLLEAQQELVKIIAVRTLSVSPGRAMLFYSARLPLLTEKVPIHGFTLSCVMKPANTTVTADRNVYTEEKVSWAFFHAGVEAGLSISRNANGIDTSWILFNKPPELSNRHAGFLLALGLNGHLTSVARWVAYRYLSPKHTMTSIGLLLGLSASFLGTMDTLVTKLLAVHVIRLLPQGAAELNLSPLAQTTGIMALGLLYCNTQHRRMSEVLISEIENTDQDENSSPMENLRDEGYRLAAGFALGYINLGQGKNLKGLHDMRVVERLLTLAVGTKRVDIVHILDKATAGATIAIALIFMKTQNEALARKVDIPDTTHQFEYVRPDIFLLRTVARHLIMWDNIIPTTTWMRKQLPRVYQPRVKLTNVRTLTTDDLPLFNIVAGLCLSVGLRYAGTARQDVRNLLVYYLDQFIRICRLPALNYDGKLTRITSRNCQDVIALAAASVMVGTGDLYIFRRLRSLHGRTDPDTPYGSQLATHLAIGVLFLGGGTYTFGTSNLAVASLLCAFYPLFPTTVLDNKSHLQAFRHFWVLAAEARCLVARDADTHRPVSVPILVSLSSGAEIAMTAPCLLPDLDTVARVTTNDPEYWRVTLDFVNNPAHLPAFRRHQSIYVRRRAAYDAHNSVFSATMQALNDAQSTHQLSKQPLDWIFDLPSFAHLDRAERALVLPPESRGAMPLQRAMRSTVVDERLVLERE
ncbi:MAG: hypothetical protein Q9187_006711, partial [Circinaria calcarea]